jgi:hypothetical protein
MNEVSTKQLTDELVKREGIRSITVKPYENVTINVADECFTLSGPAIIVINQD